MMKISLFFLLSFYSVFSFSQFGVSISGNLNIYQCKDWSKLDWDKFIDAQLAVQFPSAGSGIFQQIQKAKQICPENMSSNNIDRCTDRILGYYGQFGRNKGGMYSSRMSDDEYLKSQPAGVLELPSELANSPNGLPENWKEIAQKNGWKWVLFHSNTANQPRLVIYIPGKEYDRLLVYFSFSTRSTEPSSWFGMQMQAIENTPLESDKKLPKYYFKSWAFSGERKIPKVAHQGGRCVDCHVSGPRALVPKAWPAFPTELGGVKSVDEFNKLIVQKEQLDYSPYYDPKYFPNHLQVGKDCVQCHNGKERSSLARSIDHETGNFNRMNVYRKIVSERTMPQEYYMGSLDQADRENMIVEIQRDFKVKLNEWLSEIRCDTSGHKAKDLQNEKAPSADRVMQAQ